MTALPEEWPPPIGEDDRDTAVRRLHEAHAERHLSHEELDRGHAIRHSRSASRPLR
ncbi:hypothetical protein ACWGIB_10190 [Streptomyces xiamenensis]